MSHTPSRTNSLSASRALGRALLGLPRMPLGLSYSADGEGVVIENFRSSKVAECNSWSIHWARGGWLRAGEVGPPVDTRDRRCGDHSSGDPPAPRASSLDPTVHEAPPSYGAIWGDRRSYGYWKSSWVAATKCGPPGANDGLVPSASGRLIEDTTALRVGGKAPTAGGRSLARDGAKQLAVLSVGNTLNDRQSWTAGPIFPFVL
jgi:hypothetical protein